MNNPFCMNNEFILCAFRLVSGAGDIKLTKDGNVLLHEMVIFCFLSDFMMKLLTLFLCLMF